MDSGKAARWPALVAAKLPDDLTAVDAAGGNGYAQDSNQNFGVLATKISPTSSLVVLFGSRNDEEGYDAVVAGVNAAVANVHVAAPTAKLLMIGPAWVDGNPPPWLILARNAVRDVATKDGITFVDPLAEKWLVGVAGAIGADGIHPTDVGHAYLAQKILPLVQAQLSSK